MLVREILPGRKILRAAAATAAATLLLAAPAAAKNENYEGWYAALDLATTQPNSLDQNVASHVVDTGTGISIEALGLDNDTDFTGRLDIGYGWGNKGRLQVSFWSFDNDDSLGGTLPGSVYPTLFGYSFQSYYGAAYLVDPPVNVRASSNVKASTIDVDYLRPMTANNRISVSWLVGLRSASFEESIDFHGQDQFLAFDQGRHLESDAFGFRFGGIASFDLTHYLTLEGGAVFSFLQADTSGTATQVDLVNNLTDTNRASDDNVRAEIRDFHFRAVFTTGRLDWYVGYSVSTWDGLVVNPVPALTAFSTPPAHNRDSVSFNSASIGVKWRFQGGP